MAGGWELYEKSRGGRMTVSVYTSGFISLSQPVCEALGADYVVFLFNRLRGQIGFRAADVGDRNRYSLQRARSRAKLVNGRAFLRFYGLNGLRGRRFDARVDGDMVVVDVGDV